MVVLERRVVSHVRGTPVVTAAIHLVILELGGLIGSKTPTSNFSYTTPPDSTPRTRQRARRLRRFTLLFNLIRTLSTSYSI